MSTRTRGDGRNDPRQASRRQESAEETRASAHMEENILSGAVAEEGRCARSRHGASRARSPVARVANNGPYAVRQQACGRGRQMRVQVVGGGVALCGR